MSFPSNFTWGAATSAYQIEGAPDADGKGPSVWDRFTRRPGKVWNGCTGDLACDHYHRYAEDVAIMADIGLQAYRFSLSWPRILPDGVGRVNEAGLGFYDRLVDELLAKKITPWATLFHWDYPWELYCRGGWLHPDSPKWFSEYTAVVVDRLSDRVRHWMTLNEPPCFVGLGLQSGDHAPGDKLGLPEVLRAAHHTLLAHGRSVQVIRARAKTPPLIGWAPTGDVPVPATESASDIEAARERAFAVTDTSMWNPVLWLDPVYKGRYPEDGLRLWGDAMPRHSEADLALISQPLDWFGYNLYNGYRVRRAEDGSVQRLERPLGAPLTHLYWNITPEVLYWGPKFWHERYGLPVVITENGCSGADWVHRDGQVPDPHRIDYTARYLEQFRRAAADGVAAAGYFHWSLLDNFEWSEGYRQRFGLVHVDYPTGKRTPKSSARWYAEVIRSNGERL